MARMRQPQKRVLQLVRREQKSEKESHRCNGQVSGGKLSVHLELD